MKIDRRAFLAFGIGGAAGTALSPIGAKITDDLSIWTQMWPWTPVPAQGAYSHVASTCTLCPGGCGINVRKVDERAVKIEGLDGHPINDGGVCSLGLAGLQLLYGPTRIKSPLKRVGERGSGRWAPMGWDEAIKEVAGQLTAIRTKGQPHAVAAIANGENNTVARLMQRFLTVYGSPNFMTPPRLQDPYDLTLRVMNGVEGTVGLDAESADFVLSFGSGIIDGWGSPVRMFRAKSAWAEKGATVVQVEPRLSNTAAKADRWIAINPGTEGVLALGLARVIVDENLYNPEFVSGYTNGFDTFKNQVLADHGADKVAETTGIPADTIVALAKEFAGAKQPLAIGGRGEGAIAGSLPEFMAIHALNALTGNLNRTGGVWAMPTPDYLTWPDPEIDAVAGIGLAQGRADGAGSEAYPYSKSLLPRFAEAVNKGRSYPIELLMIHGANPLYTLAGTREVKQALENIPSVVSFSPYMDETTQFADMILPHHAYLEAYEDVSTPVGFQKPLISLAKPVVAPQYNTRHVGDVILQLAGELGDTVAGAFAWDSYEECLQESLGDRWDALNRDGFVIDADYTPPAWGAAFETPSGRFEFVNTKIELPSGFAPMGAEGDAASYPLLLIPYDTMRIAGGPIGNPPFVTKTVADNILKAKDIFVQINPETAQAHGLKEGKIAQLSTPVGKARVRVHLFEGVMPGVVAMPRGLGRSARDPYLAGKGVNVNQLIGPMEDPASGLDAAWGIRAKLA